MNLEILKNKDKSGKFKNKKYLEKNYPEEFSYLNEFSQKHGLDKLEFNELIYLINNHLYKIPICKNPNCLNNVRFHKNSYSQYCSVKCSSSDPGFRSLIKEINLRKYGVDNYAKTEESKNKVKITNLKKYGYESHNSDILIKQKKEEIYTKKYGTKDRIEYRSYYYKVLRITKKQILDFSHNLDGFEKLKENKNIQDQKLKWSIDHKISIVYGFKNHINPEIIGSIFNLQIITVSENSRKNRNNQGDLNLLITKYNNL